MAANNGLSEVKFDISDMKNGMVEFEDRFMLALKMYAIQKGSILKSYMQTNRPWTDRSGQAKRLLYKKTIARKSDITIELGHGVDYGIWLELAHEKRFAIIEPTIRIKGQDVLNDLAGFFDELKSVSVGNGSE